MYYIVLCFPKVKHLSLFDKFKKIEKDTNPLLSVSSRPVTDITDDEKRTKHEIEPGKVQSNVKLAQPRN